MTSDFCVTVNVISTDEREGTGRVDEGCDAVDKDHHELSLGEIEIPLPPEMPFPVVCCLLGLYLHKSLSGISRYLLL